MQRHVGVDDLCAGHHARARPLGKIAHSHSQGDKYLAPRHRPPALTGERDLASTVAPSPRGAIAVTPAAIAVAPAATSPPRRLPRRLGELLVCAPQRVQPHPPHMQCAGSGARIKLVQRLLHLLRLLHIRQLQPHQQVSLPLRRRERRLALTHHAAASAIPVLLERAPHQRHCAVVLRSSVAVTAAVTAAASAAVTAVTASASSAVAATASSAAAATASSSASASSSSSLHRIAECCV